MLQTVAEGACDCCFSHAHVSDILQCQDEHFQANAVHSRHCLKCKLRCCKMRLSALTGHIEGEQHGVLKQAQWHNATDLMQSAKTL